MENKRTISNKEFFRHITSLLGSGEAVRLRVKGYSMTPVIINERDDVLLMPAKGAELHKNDIVLFKEPRTGAYILHRIVGKRNETYIIRGDGNPFGKESCHVGDIAGVVVKIYRNGFVKSVVRRDSFLWHVWIFAGTFRRILARVYIKIISIVNINRKPSAE
mgnify:FL=1